jgi:hypothetical protein
MSQSKSIAAEAAPTVSPAAPLLGPGVTTGESLSQSETRENAYILWAFE